MNDYNQDIRNELNRLHTILSHAPKEQKYGYQLSVSGILNAYREGDIAFDNAVRLLELKQANTACTGRFAAWLRGVQRLLGSRQ